MAEAAQLDAYLNAMGIQRWVPKHSEFVKRQDAFADPKELLHEVQQQNEQVQGKVSAKAVIEELKVERQETPSQETPPKEKQIEDGQPQSDFASSNTKAITPTFKLAAINVPGRCLLLCDVPYSDSNPWTAQHQQLVKNLLRALSLNDGISVTPTLFSWPMFNNPAIDQTEVVAQDAVQAFVKAQLSDSPARIVLLLGEMAQNYSGLPADGNATSGTEELHVFSTSSLGEMLNVPPLKESVWQSLKPVGHLLA